MICPYCNSEQGNNVFCMKCGKKLPQNRNDVPTVKSANPINHADVGNTGKKQSITHTALVVLGVTGVIFMGIAVAIGGYILKYMREHASEVASSNVSEKEVSVVNSSNGNKADDALKEELERERQVQADAEAAAAEAEAKRIAMQEELEAAKAATAEAEAKLAEEQAAAEKAKQEAAAQQAAVAAAQAKTQATSASSTTNTSSNETMLYCCASDFATLRSQPSTKSNAIVRITTRQEVAYLGSQGDWYKVRFRGNVGYVLAKFFSTDANAPLNYDER